MQGNEGGEYKDFDENKPKPALDIVRTGLAIMANEMVRLVEKSKDGGLNGMQAMTLKEFMRAASDVHKRHPTLCLDWVKDDELETVSSERLNHLMLEAAKALKIDATDLIPNKPKRKVIEYEG